MTLPTVSSVTVTVNLTNSTTSSSAHPSSRHSPVSSKSSVKVATTTTENNTQLIKPTTLSFASQQHKHVGGMYVVSMPTTCCSLSPSCTRTEMTVSPNSPVCNIILSATSNSVVPNFVQGRHKLKSRLHPDVHQKPQSSIQFGSTDSSSSSEYSSPPPSPESDNLYLNDGSENKNSIEPNEGRLISFTMW